MQVVGWAFAAPKEPLVSVRREESPGAGEVLIEIAGCGVCHTDLGFYYDGVPTRHPLPLTLGHEISGVVVATGPGAESWAGREVVVPAVIPCGTCRACREGHGSICPKQIFPGNDVHGGFATHVRVPARGLCPVLSPSAASVEGRVALAVDVLTCPHCGGARRLIAMITEGLVVRRILDHLELPSSPPTIAPARAPPELEFAW